MSVEYLIEKIRQIQEDVYKYLHTIKEDHIDLVKRVNIISDNIKFLDKNRKILANDIADLEDNFTQLLELRVEKIEKNIKNKYEDYNNNEIKEDELIKSNKDLQEENEQIKLKIKLAKQKKELHEENKKLKLELELLVNNSIFDLLTIEKKEINDTIKNKDKRINLLENKCLKKKKRIAYPGKNVIYMLTSKYHVKENIYIIGRATNLTTRLGTYDKTCDHYVVYYKECKNEEEMDLIEDMVIKKLDKYKEVANRDRFILPIDNDIKLFTDIIDNCVNFFN